MNRFLALALTLALALSLSVTALAADTEIKPGNDGSPNPSSASTSVAFTVDPAYTITIPQTVSLIRQDASGTVTYEQDATVTASENVRLLNGQQIKVTMSAGEGEAFTLTTTQNATLSYTVTVNNSTIASGGTVATFGTSTDAQTSTLHFAADDPTYAGQYSDTVTFTISIESQSAATP